VLSESLGSPLFIGVSEGLSHDSQYKWKHFFYTSDFRAVLGLFALSRKGSYLSLGIRPVPHYLFHPLSRREYLIDEITPGIK
jgi:hypothetical protein